MSKVKEFFKSLGADAETVFEGLAHRLRATGGEHGQALATAINEDAHTMLPTLKKDVLDAVDSAFEEMQPGAALTSENVARAVDLAVYRYGTEAMQILRARLACRLEGLDPDAPMHEGRQNSDATTTGGVPVPVGTQGLDGNGAPV